METASGLELALFIMAPFSVALSAWSVWDTVCDLRWLRSVGWNGPRLIVARHNVLQESFKLAKQTIVLVVATSFVFNPPPPPDLTFLPQVETGVIGWLVVSMLMAFGSLMTRRLRIVLDGYRMDGDSRRTSDRMSGDATNPTEAA